jgi:adenylyl cyclase-associated protein
VEWAQSYYRVIRDLSEYVKQTFPHGILWNPKGVSPLEASKLVPDATREGVSKPQPVIVSGAPPPPPPPGPAPKFEIDEVPAVQAPAASSLGAVFSELNKGEAVTKGLRKVNPEEMTHKNPSLRAGATVPNRSDSQSSVSSIGRGKNPAPGKKPKPESMRTKKPPRKELDGNKWFIVSDLSDHSESFLTSRRRIMTATHNPSKSTFPLINPFS